MPPLLFQTRAGLPRALLLLLAGLCPLFAGAVETSETRHFIVVGDNFSAVRAVARIGQQMGDVGREYLEGPRDFSRKVEVRLLREPGENISPYLLREDGKGGVVVFIPWGEDTPFDMVCEALARGYLKHLVRTRYGLEPSRDLPDWIEFALSKELESRLRPAYTDYLARQGEELGLISIRDLLSERGPYQGKRDKMAVNSFWLLQFLEDEAPNANLYPRFLNACLSGRDSLALVVNAYRRQFANPAGLELWWAVGYQHEISRRTEPFETIDQSRQRLLRQAFITVEIDQRDERLTGQSLWENREREKVQRMAMIRLQQMGASLTRVNPVFYNAHYSLMVAMEAVLAGNEEAFREANEQFVEDFKTASYMENQIDQLLR